MTPPGPPLLAAPVPGFAAFLIAKLLEEHLPARLVRLEQLAVEGRLHPDLLAEVTGLQGRARTAVHRRSRGCVGIRLYFA